MEESDAFYVVRKGDVIGVYKSFSDCQQQLGSSVLLLDPQCHKYLVIKFVSEFFH